MKYGHKKTKRGHVFNNKYSEIVYSYENVFGRNLTLDSSSINSYVKR